MQHRSGSAAWRSHSRLTPLHLTGDFHHILRREKAMRTGKLQSPGQNAIRARCFRGQQRLTRQPKLCEDRSTHLVPTCTA
eukprot:4474753-Pleurochrysis_carterae.AAC.5